MLHTTLTVRVQQMRHPLGSRLLFLPTVQIKIKKTTQNAFTLIFRLLYVFSMNKNRYLRIGVLSNATNSMSKMACNEVQVMGFLLCALVIVVLAALTKHENIWVFSALQTKYKLNVNSSDCAVHSLHCYGFAAGHNAWDSLH